MIPWLIHALIDQPEQTAFRLFAYVEFRAVLAVLLSCGLVIGLGPNVIRWLVTQKIGDHPEFNQADLNALMRGKANTPTMGGVMICASIGLTALLLADFRSFYVWMALVCMFWLCVIGGIDDWLKLVAQRRHPSARQGLYPWEKLAAQMCVAVLVGWFTYRYADSKFSADLPEIAQMAKSLNLPLLKSWVYESGAGAGHSGQWLPSPGLWVMSGLGFVAFATLMIVGMSNAVNLTDGMDGLACGIMVIVAFAFVVLAMIAGYHDPETGFTLAKRLLVPHIPLADELAVIAAAMVGACVGFLWFNCSPAQVFMGDSGSLALGGLIAYIAVATRQEVLLLIIGGVYVFEAVSVILQVGYFKMSGGKRIFKCAPIHHHFHMLGWAEQQVVVRFILVTVILAAISLASIRLR